MSIVHVTAHYLKRDPDTPAQLSVRQDALNVDAYIENLLDKLKSSFLARLNRQHGSFAADVEQMPVFQSCITKHLSGEQDFSELSIQMMNAFEQQANEAGLEINAHFLFFLEKSDEHHHVFYLFIVHQNESLAISEQLDVKPSYAIDTGPSLAGIKLDIAEWQAHKNYAYLTLLCPRGKPALANVLETISGFSNGINKEEDTKTFLDGVNAFAKQLPEEQAQSCREQVVEYCLAQDEKDEPVSLQDLSREIEGIDANQFVEQVRDFHPGESDELMVDRRSLKKFVKFSGRDKDLSVAFSTYHLHSRILYDMENDTLQIKGLPKALRTQLLAYLENR